MKISEVNWGRPEKIVAREQTIMLQYQKYFYPTLHKDKQYWSMCGKCATEDGTVVENCEIDQLLKCNFIQANQFHGVDILPEVYENNIKSHHDAHWYCSDFYMAMMGNLDIFNPGIVNVDTHQMPITSVEWVSKIMALLTDVTNEVMLLANFVMVNPNNQLIRSDVHQIVTLLEGSQNFQYAMSRGKWILHPFTYTYMGGAQKQTPMTTIIMVKR